MPVVADLIEPLAEHLDRVMPAKYGQTLRDLRDVEAVLSSWYESQPWLREEELYENQAAFLRCARFLAEHLFSHQQHVLGGGETPDWLADLTRRWHSDRSWVMTLNYDTLIESAVSSILGSATDAAAAPHQSLYREFVPRLGTRSGFMVLAGDLAATFSLLKLHGSLNWWYDSTGVGARPFDGDCVDPWNRSVPIAFEDVREQARGLEPLIVPPVTSKSASLGNSWLRSMWIDAHAALEAADPVFLLGYSMPVADISMRLLLAGATTGRTLVPVDIDDRIVHRLESLFPAARVVSQLVASEDPIPSFARAYASDPGALIQQLG